MRQIAILAALLLAPVSGAASDKLRLKPGRSAQVTLPENPSTGYSWSLDASKSVGLDHVSIVDDGHAPGANLPGAPGTHRWTIRGLSVGRAAVEFVYRRPWEPAPVETRRVGVVISR
jgi:inhibitor of cysteine peptidase